MPFFNTALWTNAHLPQRERLRGAGPPWTTTVSANRAGLIWRESLAIPLYMAAALCGMRWACCRKTPLRSSRQH
jgi:hypothetical protein